MTGVNSLSGLALGGSAEPFVVLEENRFAYTAVKRLLTDRFRSVSPLVFLFGPSGAGKSHLAQHFLRTIQRQWVGTSTSCLTADDLETEAAQLTTPDPLDHLDRPRTATGRSEVLAFEDLDQITGRHELQRRLIVLLDHILRADGRCLLTSQRPPGEIRSLLPRLFNRCQSGVCAPLPWPAAASRAVLIKHFAQRRQMLLSSEVIQHLSEILPVSPRDLQAILVRLEHRARAEKRPIDVQLADRALDVHRHSKTFDLHEIAQCVARYFGNSVAELRAHRRERGSLLPRQCAMLLARELTPHSLQAIARYFGRRDHKSVLYACQRLKRSLPQDPQLRRQLADIRSALVPSSPDVTFKNC